MSDDKQKGDPNMSPRVSSVDLKQDAQQSNSDDKGDADFIE